MTSPSETEKPARLPYDEGAEAYYARKLPDETDAALQSPDDVIAARTSGNSVHQSVART